MFVLCGHPDELSVVRDGKVFFLLTEVPVSTPTSLADSMAVDVGLRSVS